MSWVALLAAATELDERDLGARQDEDRLDRHARADLVGRAVEDLAHEVHPLVEQHVDHVVGQPRLEGRERRAADDRPGPHGALPARALPRMVPREAARTDRARVVTEAAAVGAALQP